MFFKGFHSVALYRATAALTVSGLFALPFVQAPWIYSLLAVITTFNIVKIGQHIGQHRFFAHRSFKTDNIREWILGYFATLSLTGGPVVYSALHRLHHKHSDTEKDSHPLHKSFWKAFFVHIDEDEIKMNPFVIKDLLKSKPAMFFHNYYWHTIFSYILLLAIIDPVLILYCWCIPVSYSKFSSGLLSTFVHMNVVDGYQNFDTKDNSKNSIINHILTLGEGMHNNHHKYPGKYDNNVRNKWYEYDLMAPIVRRFFDVRV